MKRWALGIVPALAALTLHVAPLSADELAERTTMTQTFVVQSALDDRRGITGTGVVVHRDGDVLTLVTAGHVIRSGAPIRILDATRRAFYDVIDVRRSRTYDLAFIRVRAQPEFAVQAVDFGAPSAGEHVWVWGNPGKAFWLKATGSIRDLDEQLPGEEGARMTIACSDCGPGDSGGGVFDAAGKLLGIVTAGWQKKDGGPVLFVEVVPVAAIEAQLRAPDLVADRDGASAP